MKITTFLSINNGNLGAIAHMSNGTWICIVYKGVKVAPKQGFQKYVWVTTVLWSTLDMFLWRNKKFFPGIITKNSSLTNPLISCIFIAADMREIRKISTFFCWKLCLIWRNGNVDLLLWIVNVYQWHKDPTSHCTSYLLSRTIGW